MNEENGRTNLTASLEMGWKEQKGVRSFVPHSLTLCVPFITNSLTVPHSFILHSLLTSLVSQRPQILEGQKIINNKIMRSLYFIINNILFLLRSFVPHSLFLQSSQLARGTQRKEKGHTIRVLVSFSFSWIHAFTLFHYNSTK